ncbi:selenide, water dikinase SelD [Rhodobacter sp.]
MTEPRLTSLAHGGGCGCKIAPGVLEDILRGAAALPVPPELLVGIETSDDAAVWQLNDRQAVVATTDFFMPVVDDPRDFGRIAATNAISDVYAMGARRSSRWHWSGCRSMCCRGPRSAPCWMAGPRPAAQRVSLLPGAIRSTRSSRSTALVAIGIVDPLHLKRNSGARPGDVLVLGKPLGVGIYSSALKKGVLDAAGYGAMIDSTTRLNTPGPDLARIEGVHAMTDVTGFGLAGHALEMARGSGCAIRIDWRAVPLLPGVQALAEAGHITGASGRNWASYGANVAIDGLSDTDRALLSDPQTSGGLLVACAPDSLAQVQEVFRRHGFGQAAVIGTAEEGKGVAVSNA